MGLLTYFHYSHLSYPLVLQILGLLCALGVFKFTRRLYQVRSTVRNVANKHGIVSISPELIFCVALLKEEERGVYAGHFMHVKIFFRLLHQSNILRMDTNYHSPCYLTHSSLDILFPWQNS
jgi:hypothetical protein